MPCRDLSRDGSDALPRVVGSGLRDRLGQIGQWSLGSLNRRPFPQHARRVHRVKEGDLRYPPEVPLLAHLAAIPDSPHRVTRLFLQERRHARRGSRAIRATTLEIIPIHEARRERSDRIGLPKLTPRHYLDRFFAFL